MDNVPQEDYNKQFFCQICLNLYGLLTLVLIMHTLPTFVLDGSYMTIFKVFTPNWHVSSLLDELLALKLKDELCKQLRMMV